MKLKKPKFWDYDKPNILSLILIPIALLLQILNFIKNIFVIKRKIEGIKTICVGNIYVGGTGKTSLSLKIKDILDKKNIKACFIKKNYPEQQDEQKILQEKGDLFKDSKRIRSINHALKEGNQFAILDDGLQDLSIKYDMIFICFNNMNWIGNGQTIPAGPLRENLNNLKNYNHVFLIGNLENLEFIKKKVFQINSKISIHVAKYVPINLHDFSKNEKYIVFSGIGNHKTFVSMLKKYEINIIKDIEFPDHFQYSKKIIDKIILMSKNENCKIITTKKDYLRLGQKYNNNIKFIDVTLEILDEKKLIQSIINVYEQN